VRGIERHPKSMSDGKPNGHPSSERLEGAATSCNELQRAAMLSRYWDALEAVLSRVCRCGCGIDWTSCSPPELPNLLSPSTII
jgi:hypothetical protein